MSKNKKKKQPISQIGQAEFKEMQAVETNPVNVTSFDVESITGITGKWKDALCVCPWCDSDEFVYLFEDGQTYYCAGCNEDFLKDDLEEYTDSTEWEHALTPVDTSGIAPHQFLSDEIAEVNKAADAAYQRGLDATEEFNTQTKPNTVPDIQKKIDTTLGISGKQGSFKDWKVTRCYHAPQQVIAGKGWGVWAGKKEDCTATARNYDVVMNLTFSSIKENHSIPIPELKKWEDYSTPFIELQMDWPDYGAIGLPRKFWEELIEYLELHKAKLLIFCQGGHGRTGTAIACLMVTGLDYTAKQSITWIRKNYCSSAIESVSQEDYIRKIARKTRKETEPEVKAYSAEVN